MSKIITATEARKQFYKLLKKASKPGNKVTITLTGHAPVVMMPQEELEDWMETLEAMSDLRLVKDVEQAEQSKKFTDWEDVKKELGWDQS